MQKKTTAADVLPVPTESVEQQCLFRWAAYNRGRWPEMELMYHIPNGGTRSKSEAGAIPCGGREAGRAGRMPAGGAGRISRDVHRDEAAKGGRVSPEQAAWIDALIHEGYVAVVCRGWEEAARVIEAYMSGKMHREVSDEPV